MNRIIFPLIAIAFLQIFTFSRKSAAPLSGGINLHIIARDSARVELEKTSFKDMHVLFINDTAATNEDLKAKLGNDYGELMRLLTQQHLQPLKFMAWYYSTQAPWTMDVAIATTTVPEKLSGRIQYRMVKGGNVIIAHIWGPYDQVGEAYIKIGTWLKENNLKSIGSPFEVYVNDPSMVKSPDEIQTDVYQPVE